ncbi:MAG: 4-hydroxyphenylpyruvate dioxygenase [Xenococcaceae cyanobacterium]
MNYTVKVWEPFENPIGIDGFSFLEFATPSPRELTTVFKRFGFYRKGYNDSHTISWYAQGGINLIINNKPEGYATGFDKKHGPALSAIGWRVKDAEFAFRETVRRGAKPFEGQNAGLGLPAIYGVGDSLIYFVDKQGSKQLYNQLFVTDPDYVDSNPASRQFIDHLDHMVYPGRTQYWAEFYETVFNFREVEYYDIKVNVTGSVFKVMASPCGSMAIPIGESSKGRSWVTEYLEKVQNEGVNHIAFNSANLCDAVKYMRAQGQEFLPIPDKYYNSAEKQILKYGEDLESLRENRILIDGDDEGYLLQIFTTREPELDPLFFEFIDRRNFQGFGEGNVKTLFEALEVDQFRRGYLKETEVYASV